MFHRHEWLAAIEEGLDCDPRHAVVRKDTNPVAILPTFAVPLELPHDTAESIATALDVRLLTSGSPGSGGPVIATDERANVDRLLDAVESTTGPLDLCHRIVTHDLGEIRYGKYLQTRGYEPTSHIALFFLDIEDGWEAVYDRMDTERQKPLRGRANRTTGSSGSRLGRSSTGPTRCTAATSRASAATACRGRCSRRSPTGSPTACRCSRPTSTGRSSGSTSTSATRRARCSTTGCRRFPTRTATTRTPRSCCTSGRSGGGSTPGSRSTTSTRSGRTSTTPSSGSRPSTAAGRSHSFAGRRG